MISMALNDVFKHAVAYAKENRHEYLTVEHVFLAIVIGLVGGVALADDAQLGIGHLVHIGQRLVQPRHDRPGIPERNRPRLPGRG